MSNPNGHPATLLPGTARPETPNYKHGLNGQQPRPYDERAQEIAEELMTIPHLTAIDAPAVREVATLMALIERLDACLSDGRFERRDWTPRRLVDQRRQLSRELREWSDRLGMNPLARATWARTLTGGTLAGEIRRRLEASS